jgi:outer membrane protein
LNKIVKSMSLKTYIIAGLMLVSLTASTFAQNILSKSDAVSIALENNFDIRTANNNVDIARNNSGIKNSGYLPSISASAGANFSLSDTKTTLQTGEIREVNGVSTSRYNGSVGLNYTIFDGMARENTFKSLKENYNLTELQARFVIENSLLNIFGVYYEVARLTENVLVQREALTVSRRRLQREQYGSEYGQNTQLDVLNAEVDYNNDSINYLVLSQQLANEKRNLNLLLGRDVNIAFDADTTINYTLGVDVEVLRENASKNNVNILQEQAGIRNSEYSLKAVNAGTIPKLGLSAAYGANQNNLGPTSFADKQSLLGPSAGLSLSWNIFDGGSTNTRKQNARITLENQKVSYEQVQMNVDRDLSNAWTIYQTSLFVLQAELTNLQTNKRNFDRTVEQYALGQITQIVFRQAQINYLNAKLSYNQAKYSAKNAELSLFQLSGDLLEAQF